MYTLIYDFITQHLFNNNALSTYETEILGVQTTLSEWLGHTLTIISMVLIFIFLVFFIKWVFKFVSGLFSLRG